MSRTKRRALTGSQRFDSSCRNHGSCPWCVGNRTHADAKQRSRADEQLRDLDAGVFSIGWSELWRYSSTIV